MMKSKYVLLASALSAMTLTTPAMACDYDGLPGMGGFHRFNPFAAAARGYDVPEPVPDVPVAEPQDEAKASGDKKEARKKDRKRRQESIEKTPVREWELDVGNGTISEVDKATFT